MSKSKRDRQAVCPEDWEFTSLAQRSDLPIGDYWIGDPVPHLKGALLGRFVDFINMAELGSRDTYFRLGGFPAYCRATLGGAGRYYVRAPLLRAPGGRKRETRTIAINHGYMACLPITALTQLTGSGESRLLAGNAGFSALTSFRPRYSDTDYIFSTSPPVAATAALHIRPGEDAGEYLDAAVRKIGHSDST